MHKKKKKLKEDQIKKNNKFDFTGVECRQVTNEVWRDIRLKCGPYLAGNIISKFTATLYRQHSEQMKQAHTPNPTREISV